MDSALGLAKVTENDSALLCLKTQGSSVSYFLSLTMCQIRHRSLFITIIIQIFLALKSTTQVQCLGLGSLGYPWDSHSGHHALFCTGPPLSSAFASPFWLHPGHLGVMVGMLV